MTRLGRECDWNLDDEKQTCAEVAFALSSEPPSRGLTEAELAQAEARQKPRPEATDVEYEMDVRCAGNKQQKIERNPRRAAPTGGGARSTRRDGHPSRP